MEEMAQFVMEENGSELVIATARAAAVQLQQL